MSALGWCSATVVTSLSVRLGPFFPFTVSTRSTDHRTQNYTGFKRDRLSVLKLAQPLVQRIPIFTLWSILVNFCFGGRPTDHRIDERSVRRIVNDPTP